MWSYVNNPADYNVRTQCGGRTKIESLCLQALPNDQRKKPKQSLTPSLGKGHCSVLLVDFYITENETKKANAVLERFIENYPKNGFIPLLEDAL